MSLPTIYKPAALCALVWVCASAAAAPVTLIGADMDLVYDSALVGRFGTPTLVGNTIFFTPNEQRVESTNGAGNQVLVSMLSGISLQAKNGFRFDAFDVAVFGDYRLSGAGSQVQVGGELRAFNATLPGAAVMTASLLADPHLPLNISSGGNLNWAATAHIASDTAAEAGGLGAVAVSADRIGLELDLILSAYTDPAQTGLRQAFIENKFGGLAIHVVGVEPGLLRSSPPLTLMAPLLLALLWIRSCSDLAKRRA